MQSVRTPDDELREFKGGDRFGSLVGIVWQTGRVHMCIQPDLYLDVIMKASELMREKSWILSRIPN